MKVYVIPAVKPLISAVLPVLESVIEPGDPLTVQLPAGKPERETEPVDKAQVGCTTRPIIGAAGVVTGFINA